jgi:tetratricopeptide (TPR) repeat protein
VLGRLEAEGVCLVAGPAGTGKSSLAAAVASGWSQSKALWYTCHEGESAEGLIWALAGYLHGQGRTDMWRWLHSAAQPGVAPPPIETLIRTLIGQLRGLPCLLCLDDLHLVAGDPAMSNLLGQLIAETKGGTLTLLATAQQAPLQFMPTMQVALEGFNQAEAEALLTVRGISLAPELTAQLIEITAGNPQFLTLAAAALQQGADPAGLVRELPRDERVAEYLVTAVDRRLSNEQREIMRAVAVLLGEPASHDLIEALLERDDTWADIQVLRGQRLLNPQASTGRLAYTQHGIVQGFYYGQIGRRGRRLFHGKAADYYEHDEPVPLRAAQHYLLADNQHQAARLALRDLWGTINAGEARQLATLLGQIEGAQVGPVQAVEVALARGDLATLLGMADEAEAQYESAMTAAEGLDVPTERALLLARAYRGMGGLLEYSNASGALGWLQRGLEVVEAVPAEKRNAERTLLQHRIGSALLALGEYDAALAALETAIEQLPPTAHQARAGLLVNIGIAHCSQGRMDEGRDSFERAIAAYTLAEDVWGLNAARHNLAQVIEIAGEWERAAVEYAEVLAFARKLGDVRRQVRVGLSLGILQTNKGEYAAAERLLIECIELARASDDREGTLAAQSSLADLDLRRGRPQRADELIDAAEALALSIAEDHPQLAEILRSRAQLLLAEGQAGVARIAAERALAIAEGLEDPREQGMSQRVLGLVALAEGQRSEGFALLTASITLLDEADPYEAARSRLAHGRALRAAGDNGAADSLLSAARATFATLGARREIEAVDGVI